jgi:hypothetical protein
MESTQTFSLLHNGVQCPFQRSVRSSIHLLYLSALFYQLHNGGFISSCLYVLSLKIIDGFCSNFPLGVHTEIVKM